MLDIPARFLLFRECSSVTKEAAPPGLTATGSKAKGVKEVRKPKKRRFGYVGVNLADKESAVALAGQSFEGHVIKVEESRYNINTPRDGGQQQKREFSSANDACTLFLKGLADSVNLGKLKQFFSKATEVHLPQKDSYHRGFAYLVFANSETKEKVMGEKLGSNLEGSALNLEYTGSRISFKPCKQSFGGDNSGLRAPFSGECGTGKVMFVYNLSYQIDEDSLKEHFPNAVSA